MEFGTKLKHFVKYKFKKIKIFSDVIGKDEGYLQKIFTGKLTPGKEFLVEVMKLGCDMTWLLDDSKGIEDFPGVHPVYNNNSAENFNPPDKSLNLRVIYPQQEQNKSILDSISIGRRLESFAIENFGNIKILADRLDIALSYLKESYLNGKNLPSIKMISDLARLGCNINWLLHGTEFQISENKSVYTNLHRENEELQSKIKELNDKLSQVMELFKNGE